MDLRGKIPAFSAILYEEFSHSLDCINDLFFDSEKNFDGELCTAKASSKDISDRLDFMGYTREYAATVIKTHLEKRQDEAFEDYRNNFTTSKLSSLIPPTTTYEAILSAYKAASKKKSVAPGSLAYVIRKHEQLRYLFPFASPITLLRISIDAFGIRGDVIWRAHTNTVRAIDRSMIPLVIVEGPTDVKFIKMGLEHLHPALAGYFEIDTFETGDKDTSLGGGAQNLARSIAIMGRVEPSREIVGVFDNDAAGHAALEICKKANLPQPITVMTYPDCELGKAYPAVGTGGVRTTNINGLACSLEIYFGKLCLADKTGSLAPVEWKTKIETTQKWQGSLTPAGKGDAQTKFNQKLSRMKTLSPEEKRLLFPEMDLLLSSIIEKCKRFPESPRRQGWFFADTEMEGWPDEWPPAR